MGNRFSATRLIAMKCQIGSTFAAVVLAGCSTTPTPTDSASSPRPPAVNRAGNGGITPEHLRLQLDSLERQLSAGVIAAARRISTGTSSPRVQRAALVWKMHTIPVCRGGLRQSEPVIRLLDLWAFAVQLREFLTTGSGQALFGGQQHIGQGCARSMERNVRRVARAYFAPKDFQKVSRYLKRWVKAHPIEDSLGRQAGLADFQIKPGFTDALLKLDWFPLTDLTGLDSTAKAIDHLAHSAEHSTRLLQQIPEMARWQLELLAYDVVERPAIARTLKGWDRFSQGLVTLAATARDAVAFVKDPQTVAGAQRLVAETNRGLEQAERTARSARSVLPQRGRGREGLGRDDPDLWAHVPLRFDRSGTRRGGPRRTPVRHSRLQTDGRSPR